MISIPSKTLLSVTALFAQLVIVMFANLTTTSAAAGAVEPGSDGFEGTFRDDDGSVHEHNIEFLVQQGIALECGEDHFCPSSAVTHTQMSAFLHQTAVHLYGSSYIGAPSRSQSNSVSRQEHVTRADAAEMVLATFQHLSASSEVQGIFSDIADMQIEVVRAVEGLHDTGIVQGCATAPLRFCPSERVTRAQVASLLARVLHANDPTVGLILAEPESAKGYVLFTSLNYPPVYLVDNQGKKIHVWDIGHNCYLPKLLENGNLMCMVDRRSTTGKIVEVGQQNNVVWQYDIPHVHHDFLKLPNGNVLMILSYLKTPDEAIAAGVNPDCIPSDGKEIRVDYVIEVEPTGTYSGEVVWRWHVWDHLIQDLYPDKANYGKVSEYPGRIDVNLICSAPIRESWIDWTHTNSIDFNQTTNQIMLSPRNFNEFWIIDHTTDTEEAAGRKGDILYRWGNPQTYRAGNSKDQQFFWQHNPHWIPSGLPGAGNILVYNNGAGTVDEIVLPPSFVDSSGMQTTSDQVTLSSEIVWSHTLESRALFKSAAQRLKNGNTFITTSHLGTFSQVTPDMRTVWKYISPVATDGIGFQGEETSVDNGVYRATWYPHDYPGLQGLDLTPKGPLELFR